jgi:MOSC domain-containing protein YiiM
MPHTEESAGTVHARCPGPSAPTPDGGHAQPDATLIPVSAVVEAVSTSATHTFSKHAASVIVLVEGQGVAGDAHCGVTVKHRSRVRANPSQPNQRQVHLIHAELLDQLADAGHVVAPGELGENITTRGIGLLELPVGSCLSIGDCRIMVTGLRNPCQQINDFQTGLLKQVLRTDEKGSVVRLAGVMAIVSRGGEIRPGDLITVKLPPEPHLPLTTV